jgi:hypothetical protein
LEEYYKECLLKYNKIDSPINYKFMLVANKQYFCEVCGVEIHRHENYWRYKPNPVYHKATKDHKGFTEYFTWRYRCQDHEPKHHSEIYSIQE